MEEFLKVYTIKELSELLDVPVGTLRQWERDFKDVIEIPRDSKGARYYTDFEIGLVKHVKVMRDKKLSKDIIRELLKKRNKAEGNTSELVIKSYVPQMKQSEVVETLKSIKEMMAGFEEFKGSLTKELREDICKEVRKEVIEEVYKEIASSSEEQQKILQEGALVISKQFEDVSKSLKEMEARYEDRMKKRDEVLMENVRLLQEIKSEQKKGFWEKLFGK